MPRQVVFPCPNCGASQSVDEDSASTQCQFCGNSISVPEELRPKTPPPAPATPAFSFGNAAGMPSMTGMPGMFLNMDVAKLKAMAMAARSGDQAEAARLYSEAFGASPEDAKQAAELMAAHHPLVLGQMNASFPGVIQIRTSSTGPATYSMSSPPLIASSQPAPLITNSQPARRNTTCIVLFVFLAIAAVLAVSLIILLPTLLARLGPTLGR